MIETVNVALADNVRFIERANANRTVNERFADNVRYSVDCLANPAVNVADA